MLGNAREWHKMPGNAKEHHAYARKHHRMAQNTGNCKINARGMLGNAKEWRKISGNAEECQRYAGKREEMARIARECQGTPGTC